MAESKLDMSFDDSFEELICEESGTAEENEFDFTVGALEDIMLDDEFTRIQNDFCKRHCDEFDESEENKLSHHEIFQEFTGLIEGTLERMLERRIPVSIH
mmetsp:Transcript_9835/g.14814  ORF Transcript_9835/g.14814 Transcript_9835/m.14814 type:complete len:100 (+) Transcript_9835:65-364(+)